MNSEGGIKSSVDILQALHKRYPRQCTSDMVDSKYLQCVVQAYIDDPEIDARDAAHYLTYFLQSFRLMSALLYKEIRNPYHIDREGAADCIHRAAVYLSSSNPNYSEVVSSNREQLEKLKREDSGIMDLSVPDNIRKLAKADLLSHALESIADAIGSMADDQVAPGVMSMQILDPLSIDNDNLKAGVALVTKMVPYAA